MCGTTSLRLEDEVTLRVGERNDPRLQKLMFEIFELLVMGRSPLDKFHPRCFEEGIAEVRKRSDNVPVVVAGIEKRGEAFAFVGLGPLPNFLEFGWVGEDAVIGHHPTEVVHALCEKGALGGVVF